MSALLADDRWGTADPLKEHQSGAEVVDDAWSPPILCYLQPPVVAILPADTRHQAFGWTCLVHWMSGCSKKGSELVSKVLLDKVAFLSFIILSTRCWDHRPEKWRGKGIPQHIH